MNASELDCAIETSGAAPGSAGQPPVRVGLGYVAEVAEADAEAVIAERRRGGAFRDIADLAGRSGASRAALLRLAWAGACDRLARVAPPGRTAKDDAFGAGGAEAMAIAEGGHRRPALWESGAAARAARSEDGTQLALPLDGSPSPALPLLGPWERTVADYRMTGTTLGEHPMELMRPQLDSDVATSADLHQVRDGSPIRVAGMVVARQRPATAKGIVFMLLEDELGTINLIVPPPAVERFRVAVRTAGFVIARGRLEHREGTTNVLVGSIERLERSGLPSAPSRAIAPPVSRETGRGGKPARVGRKAAQAREVVSELDRPGREQIVSELAAALPAPHSFGRRGR